MIGNFYYKQSANGNLLGEFSNNSTSSVIPDSCLLISIFQENFVGSYQSTWIENENSSGIFTLEIQKLSNQKFKLTWQNNEITFLGEGFIVDNMLIGFYFPE